MKSKDVLKLLGITRVTLWSYVKKGIIKVTKLKNGFYDYDEQSVHNFIGKNKKINVIYGRVSTYKQKDDLIRQVNVLKEYCKHNNIIISNIYSEISSGIDLNRNKFKTKMSNNLVFKRGKI